MDRPNKTAQDAFERVLDAKTGSLAFASDDYLFALRNYVLNWSAQIEAECMGRVMSAQAAAKLKAQEEFEAAREDASSRT